MASSLVSAAALGMLVEQFASLLVGRWPSGAPIMRTPAADDAALAGDMWANNHFIFNDHTRPSVLRPIPGYVGDGFAQATADLLGNVCPTLRTSGRPIHATLRPISANHMTACCA